VVTNLELVLGHFRVPPRRFAFSRSTTLAELDDLLRRQVELLARDDQVLGIENLEAAAIVDAVGTPPSGLLGDEARTLGGTTRPIFHRC
jgi:hypothetical protein